MAGYPQPPEPDEREVRLRCNAAMGWTRWQADARRPVGPMPPFKTREEEISWISERLGGHREEPGSEVGVYRNKELLATYYAICVQMVRAGIQIPQVHDIPSATSKESETSADKWRKFHEALDSARLDASGWNAHSTWLGAKYFTFPTVSKPPAQRAQFKPTLVEYYVGTATMAAVAFAAIAVSPLIGAPLASALAAVFVCFTILGFVGMWRDYPQVRRAALIVALIAVVVGVATFAIQRQSSRAQANQTIHTAVKHER